MLQAPWTEIGSLQDEIRNIKSSMWKYAESHKVDEINRRVDSLERSVREFGFTLNGFQHRLQETEDRLDGRGYKEEDNKQQITKLEEK